ncbi:MAG: penicillin acylase family protein, partial [Desulfomonilia bacterium]|nr:penicillin acylase family protein [Desulfomonilia bacterium]
MMQIHRDAHGVAHIEGSDLKDVVYGQGYAHGRDRALQLYLMRILGQGRGSELLDAGDEMLAIDTFFRRMNWASHMECELEKLTPEVRDLFQAYCSGINRACAEQFPWELKLLGYCGEPWRIEDIIMISRMFGFISLAQSQGEMERLLVEMVQAGVSEDKLHELFPGILNELDLDLVRQVKLSERIVSPVSLWNTAAASMMASNNWVVSGTRTASGKPILCNDPHLEINRIPGIWYEVVMKTPEQYAIGSSFPGVPGILVGRTSKIAWGATYAFMDATDSWIEHCENGRYLREPDTWIPFRERREVIMRRKKAPVEIVCWENEHGILDGNPHEQGLYLATSWAPTLSGAASVSALMDMWHAQDVQQGMEILRTIESAWCFVLADVHGNIGFQMSGMMPKRREGISGLVPLPGWKAENDWLGIVEPEDLPQ